MEDLVMKHTDLLFYRKVIRQLRESCEIDRADYRQLYKTFFTSEVKEDPIIVFYCEFSSQRAPNMYCLTRRLDREMNEYPNVKLPNIFVLNGGYE